MACLGGGRTLVQGPRHPKTMTGPDRHSVPWAILVDRQPEKKMCALFFGGQESSIFSGNGASNVVSASFSLHFALCCLSCAKVRLQYRVPDRDWGCKQETTRQVRQ